MSLTRTIAGSSLAKRPGRTVFSILGVGIGIAIAVAVFTLDHNTVLGLSLPGLQDWKPALEVRPARGVADPRGDLEKTEGIAGVSAIFQNDVSIRHDAEKGEPARARLFAIEARALGQIEATGVTAGRLLDPGSPRRQALLGTELAEALGIAPGARVLLSRPAQGPRRGCVDGQIRVLDPDAPADRPAEESFEVVGILAREKLGRRSQGMVVVVDFDWGRDLYRGVDLDPVYWVRQDPAVDLERLKSSLARSFSYELNKSVIVGAAAQERAFRNGVRMAGLLALVLGLYVIFHTLSIALVERVREIAVLHALGAGRGQITRIFLTEAGIIATAAAVIGVGLGLALARVLLVLGITTLGTGHRIRLFDVPWGAVLALAGMGVGMALLGSVYPLLRARGVNPAAVLRGEAAPRHHATRGFHLLSAVLLAVVLPGLYFVVVPVVGEAQGVLIGAVVAAVGILAGLVILPLLFPALVRALSNLLAHPLRRLWTFSGRMASYSIRGSGTRIAVSAAAIALVASSFVALKGMTASLRAEIVVWAQEAIVSKVYAGRMPPTSLSKLRARLGREPGFVALENGGARTYVPFLLLGADPDELRRHGPCHDDAAVALALERREGVVLSRQLARHLGYARGDVVHVANAAGVVQGLTVAAISDAYGYFPNPDERLYGVVSDEFMRRAFCLDVENSTEVAVVVGPGSDPDAFKAAVGEVLPEQAPMSFSTGRGLLGAHLEDIDRDFRLFDLILGLTALLAGLGLLNGLLLSALERTKEIGVLGALGTTRRQVAGMVLGESAVVGVLGGSIGTALGAALTPVIVRALEALSALDLPTETAGPWLAWVPAGSIVLALVASLVPIARMNRTDPVAAVRTG